MKLADTSAWIEYLRGTKSPTDMQVRALLQDREAAWCEIIALELANFVSAHQESRLQKVTTLAWMLDIDSDVWAAARVLATAARRKGITAPLPDYVVFVCSKIYGHELVHKDDGDFGRLERVNDSL